MELIEMSNGEIVDLHDKQGCYRYVGQFLVQNAAPSDVFAALENLHDEPKDKKQNPATGKES